MTGADGASQDAESGADGGIGQDPADGLGPEAGGGTDGGSQEPRLRETTGGADRSGQEPAAPEPGDGAGWRSVLAEEFSFSEAMGGVRGMVESVLPGLTFVVVYVIRPELLPPLIASLVLAAGLAVARLIRRSSVMGAVSGLGGIGLGVVWALLSGKPEGFFAPGLWINGAYLAACLVSIAARWPLVALVCALATGKLGTFREDKAYVRRGMAATWAVAGLFAARLAVQLPLYFAGEVVPLGTVKLAMGAPCFVAVLWLAWLIMRPVLRPAPPAP
ncbi:MAG: DUF3159 domain-containing protein [Bifidobacteriaceae bacterium]|jgi:hypothetical protein|nr:DUF3159 domain-containing protein [Bifidobacteriaceae bacterium]